MGKLLKSLNPSKVLCLSAEGIRRDLNDVVSNLTRELPNNSCVWVVGGFAHGHFSDEVKRLADDLISISSYSLPAHVVTARLSYEIERIPENIERRFALNLSIFSFSFSSLESRPKLS